MGLAASNVKAKASKKMARKKGWASINFHRPLVLLIALGSSPSAATEINVSVWAGQETILFGWAVFPNCVLSPVTRMVITEAPINGRAFVGPNLTLSPVDPKCRKTPAVRFHDVYRSAPALYYTSNAGFKGKDSVEVEVQPDGPRVRYIISAE